MKSLLIALFLLPGYICFAQQNEETNVSQLSAGIFAWEVANRTDSLRNAFHEKFMVVSSDGSSSRKEDYLKRLQSGDFVHNNISVEESSAIVSGNTAVVAGKGKFEVTVSGNKVSLRLSYIEVFTRENADKPWQVLAMKASVLDK